MHSHKILSISEINFPIYTISENYIKIWEELNVTYIKTNSGTYVLDNKNIAGDTLGERRVKIKNDLYIPKRTYYNTTQLIKSNKSKFIDNYGTIFTYKKQTYVPLKYYRITNIIRLDNGCLVEIKSINYSMKLRCVTAYSINYIGLLHTNLGYIPYEFCEDRKVDTIRKI